jgi:hypothetical protein
VADEFVPLPNNRPGWITSLGAFAALALSGYNSQSQRDDFASVQRFNEKNDARLVEAQRRIWDGINDDRKIFARFTIDEANAREQLRVRVREEILSDTRREFDVRFGEQHGR